MFGPPPHRRDEVARVRVHQLLGEKIFPPSWPSRIQTKLPVPASQQWGSFAPQNEQFDWVHARDVYPRIGFYE